MTIAAMISTAHSTSISASGLLLRFFTSSAIFLSRSAFFVYCTAGVLTGCLTGTTGSSSGFFSTVSLGTAGVPWFLNFFESISTCSELIGPSGCFCVLSDFFCPGFLTLESLFGAGS